MAKRIVIYGAGGFGREVLQVIEDINAALQTDPVWEPAGFLVDSQYFGSHLVHGLPLLDANVWLPANPDVEIVIAVGAPAHRKNIADRIGARCSNGFATLIHPLAWLGSGVELGKGVVVCAGSLITTDIRIGNHVHVNIGSTIGHDAILDDFVTLNPSVNVSGNVNIGTGSEIGTGTVVIPHANIGAWSIVGAGAVVTKTVPPDTTAVGSPARVIKTRRTGWHEDVG